MPQVFDNKEDRKRNGRACASVSVRVDKALPEWGDYLASNPDATIFHDPRWLALMRETYSNDAFYLTARRAERIVGVLPLVWKKSLLFGSYLCSIPYFDSCGILADDDEVADGLITKCEEIRRELNAQWVELRQDRPLTGHFQTKTDKVTVVLSLPESANALWEQFKSKIRNHIRKAEKEGLTSRTGGPELLNRFYSSYASTMRDLGSPPHSRRFFRAIVNAFGEQVGFHVAEYKGRTAAASLTLRDGRIVRVPWSGSDRRLRHFSGNTLLYWEMMKDACARGAAAFDFGRGTRGGGTYRFKMQWGGGERPLYWQYLLPEGAPMPGLKHDNPKFRFIEAVWRRLPMWVVRALGPRIISKLS